MALTQSVEVNSISDSRSLFLLLHVFRYSHAPGNAVFALRDLRIIARCG